MRFIFKSVLGHSPYVNSGVSIRLGVFLDLEIPRIAGAGLYPLSHDHDSIDPWALRPFSLLPPTVLPPGPPNAGV
jgi:hypothetical protein